MQDKTKQHNAKHDEIGQGTTKQYNTIDTIQANIGQYNIRQYNAIHDNTRQDKTIHRNTIQ